MTDVIERAAFMVSMTMSMQEVAEVRRVLRQAAAAVQDRDDLLAALRRMVAAAPGCGQDKCDAQVCSAGVDARALIANLDAGRDEDSQ